MAFTRISLTSTANFVTQISVPQRQIFDQIFHALRTHSHPQTKSTILRHTTICVLDPRASCLASPSALTRPHTHHNRHRPVSRRGRPSQSCHVTHPWPHPPLGSDWCWLAVGAETFALRGSFSRVVPQFSKNFPSLRGHANLESNLPKSS